MMSGCVVYASCLISSCLLVMPLMLTCNMDMPVARGVLIGLCGVFLGVGVSFLLFACVGVECCGWCRGVVQNICTSTCSSMRPC